jgi:hypothetical protein
MSMRNDLALAFATVREVESIAVGDVVVHGEEAMEVTVTLVDGRTVTGTFTTEARPGFGGVEFATRKDVAQLMRSKVAAVLRGTAEVSAT